MLKSIITSILAVTVVAAACFVAPTAEAGASTDIRLRARLEGNTLASGKSDYRERFRNGVLEQRFKVQVEDATPGDELEVRVNGMLFGTIIVNNLGGAEMEFRTAQFIDDPGDGTPIPTDFPQLMAGDTITVGDDLSGVYE